MVIRDRYIGVAAAMAGSVIWHLSTTLPEVPVHGDVGPGFFPKLIAAALLLVSISLFLLDGVTRKNGKQEVLSGIDKSTCLRIGALLLLTSLYVVSMPLAGFVAATAAYLFCCGLLFSNRHWIRLLLFSAGCSGALYVVFKVWLRVPLPA